MSSILRPKKKKVLSAKKVWKGITNTPRACLDMVVRYIRRPTYPAKPCFFSGRRQEKRRIIFMQEEEQRQNPSSRIMIRKQEKMEGINVTPEAASSSASGNADDSIVDDSIKRYDYREENSSLHDAAGTSDDDSIFEDFIRRNRERFQLEKENSLERLNYYALWPYCAYFDPDC